MFRYLYKLSINISFFLLNIFYSFGVILWELISKQVPWDGMYPPAITAKVVAGERPQIDSQWPQPVRDLISASWAQDPSIRPSVKKGSKLI